MRKLLHSVRKKVKNTGRKAAAILSCNRGELATNTIGGIIVAVVIIGLLIVAVNQFFPSFFSDMFNKMADKLNGNW